jgi:hypothetical protein
MIIYWGRYLKQRKLITQGLERSEIKEWINEINSISNEKRVSYKKVSVRKNVRWYIPALYLDYLKQTVGFRLIPG